MTMFRDFYLVWKGHLTFKELVGLKADVARLEALEKYYIRELRKLDDFIFNLSQAPDRAAMQRILGPAVDEMMQRKEDESRRITNLLIPELERTYRP